MKRIELFINLKYFDDKDFENFYLYLKSPVFGPKTGVIEVFKIIASKRHHLATQNYAKIKSIIRKRRNLNENTLMKVYSHLNGYILDYLKLKVSMFQNDMYPDVLLAKHFLYTGNLYSYKTYTHRFGNKLSDGGIYDFTYTKYLHSLNQYNHSAVIYPKTNKLSLIKQEEQTVIAMGNLYMNTIIELTMLFTNLVTKYIETGKTNLDKINLNLLHLYNNKAIEDLYSKRKKHHTAFLLFKKLHTMYLDLSNDDLYFHYKSFLNENYNDLPFKLQRYHYYATMNYTILRQRIGYENDFFVNENLYFTSIFFKRQYYKDATNQYINPILALNYIMQAFNLNNPKAIKEFIDANSDNLSPKDAIDLSNYGLSHYYFLIGKYTNALSHMCKVSNTDGFNKYNLRNLELKILFKSGQYAEILQKIHNYKATVTDDKFLNKNDRTRFFNFIKVFTKVVNVVANPVANKELIDIEILRLKVNNRKHMFMKNWIVGELDIIISNLKSISAAK